MPSLLPMHLGSPVYRACMEQKFCVFKARKLNPNDRWAERQGNAGPKCSRDNEVIRDDVCTIPQNLKGITVRRNDGWECACLWRV